jgi:cell division septum initiation protein DivIVA
MTANTTEKEVRAWQKAVEDARTTIQYLEQRGKEKQKRIRELEAKLKEHGVTP